MADTVHLSATPDVLAAFKRVLHAELPRVKSSHLSEALAAALGFNTHAALLAHLSAGNASVTLAVSDARFVARLTALGYSDGAVSALHVASWVQAVHAPSGTVGAELGLQRSPLERCRTYGVRIERRPNGEVFALHNVAGAVGPCIDEHGAARLACEAWGI